METNLVDINLLDLTSIFFLFHFFKKNDFENLVPYRGDSYWTIILKVLDWAISFIKEDLSYLALIAAKLAIIMQALCKVRGYIG